MIHRTTGGRNEGSADRSHRRNSAGTLASQIRQEQPNLVDPPRWFTARRKLVKFKSAFKTGLARCPTPPGAATAGKRYRGAPTGVYRSDILGKLWMDFPPQITAPLASCSSSLALGSPCSFSDKEDQEENSSYQVVAKMPGQDFRRNVAVLSEPTAPLFQNSKLL